MKKHLYCLSATAILVIIFGTIYVVTQQAQRSEANYPQIQLAEDTATELDQGKTPEALVKGEVDIKNSLAPFVVVYDKNGHVVKGSGQLNGKVPAVPKGVLTESDHSAYNAVTWEPQTNVRIASVTVAAKDYYVLSGRSMKEVENNENNSFMLSALGGAASLVVVGITCLLGRRK